MLISNNRWSSGRGATRIRAMSLSTILLILAFIAFVLAAVGWSYRKTNLLAVGLALWVLSLLVTQIHL